MGWVVNSEDIFEEEINKQVQIAIEEADVILFVVDASNGVTDLDDQVASILRRSKKLSDCRGQQGGQGRRAV